MRRAPAAYISSTTTEAPSSAWTIEFVTSSDTIDSALSTASVSRHRTNVLRTQWRAARTARGTGGTVRTRDSASVGRAGNRAGSGSPAAPSGPQRVPHDGGTSRGPFHPFAAAVPPLVLVTAKDWKRDTLRLDSAQISSAISCARDV